MNIDIESSWENVLSDLFEKPEFNELTNFVCTEYQRATVYPTPADIFKAFWLTPFNEVAVVILGQDPYHGTSQAHGLCFSVQDGITPPPSLKNIYKEIENDIGTEKNYESGNLESWAQQGVFLLNAILSVEAHKPASHRNKGWEEFTDYVIQKISDEREHVVFMLWGNFAHSKKILINTEKHLVLEAPHPSPLSAYKGFFGCKHFSKCNKYLEKYENKKIEW